MNLSKRFCAVVSGGILLFTADGHAWPVLDFNEVVPLAKEVSTTVKSLKDLNQQLQEIEQETKAIGDGISTISSFMPDLGNTSSEEESSDAADAIDENTTASDTANDDVVDVISETISEQEEVTNDWVSTSVDDVDFETIEDEYRQLSVQFNDTVNSAINTLYTIAADDEQTLLDLKGKIKVAADISAEDKVSLINQTDTLVNQLKSNTTKNLEVIEGIKEKYNSSYTQEMTDKLSNYKNTYEAFKIGETDETAVKVAQDELIQSISTGVDVEEINAAVTEIKTQRSAFTEEVKILKSNISAAVKKNASGEN
jgi:hypothetical protein